MIFTRVLLLILTAFSFSFVLADSKPVAKVAFGGYYYDAVTRNAYSLGVATKSFTPLQNAYIFNRLNINGQKDVISLPTTVVERWNQLVYTAQILTYIKTANKHFFAGGFEVESTHNELQAWRDFDVGAQNILGLVAGHFGRSQGPLINPVGPIAVMKDAKGREWNVKTEWTREGEGKNTPYGWEVNSPPFFNPDDLEAFTAFLWRLGESPFGQIAQFCGIHQNYDVLPVGHAPDEKLAARVIANFLLLHEQFVPTIIGLLNVERYGGFDNLFMRPYIFDHAELLKELSAMDPLQMTMADVENLQKKYLRKEFEIQTSNHLDTPEQRLAVEPEWQTYRQNWKARDVRIKWNGPRTIIESRILDHKPKEPWVAVTGILINQLLLNKAYELASRGEVWKFSAPSRLAGETVPGFWTRLQQDSQMGIQKFISTMGIRDSNLIALLTERNFKTKKEFTANEKVTFGFEVEFFSPKIVSVLVPNNPEFRPVWDKMRYEERVKWFHDNNFKFEPVYNEKKYRLVTSEFRLDVDRYPDMELRPHIEDSGRLEVMSNGRGITTTDELAASATEILAVIAPDEKVADLSSEISFHFHAFVPDSLIKRMSPEQIHAFVRFFERLTLFMTTADYLEGAGSYPPHRLDSWSLDRFSPFELKQLEDHLLGKIVLSNKDQKHHNVGFRPVNGGVDFEVRSIGADVKWGQTILKMIVNAVEKGDFGPFGSDVGPHLFMEPQHYQSQHQYRPFTLLGALEARGTRMTSRQRAILRKLQFEIYKPSMKSYVHLPNEDVVETIPPERFDPALLRTNFESNISLPLLDWASQGYVSKNSLMKIKRARAAFVDKVWALVQRIETDPRYQFLLEHDDFLYLCIYLARSSHPDKPELLVGPLAKSQRKVLADLVFELRTYVVSFLKESEVSRTLARSLPGTQTETRWLSNTAQPLVQKCEDLLSDKAG